MANLFSGRISSYLISIFMNIDENLRNVETFRGVPTQLPISRLLTTLVYHKSMLRHMNITLWSDMQTI